MVTLSSDTVTNVTSCLEHIHCIMVALKETCRCENVENVQNRAIIEVETMRRFFFNVQDAARNKAIEQELQNAGQIESDDFQIGRDDGIENTDGVKCRLDELSINVDSMLTRMSAIINSENPKASRTSHRSRAESLNHSQIAEDNMFGDPSCKNSFNNSSVIQDLTHNHVQRRIDRIHDSLWRFVSSIEPKGSSFLTSTKLEHLSNPDLLDINNETDANQAPFRRDDPRDETCNVVIEELDADDFNAFSRQSSFCIISEYESEEFESSDGDVLDEFDLHTDRDLIGPDAFYDNRYRSFSEPSASRQELGVIHCPVVSGRFLTEAVVDQDFVPFLDSSLFNHKRTNSNAQIHAQQMTQELSEQLASTRLKNSQKSHSKVFPEDSISLQSDDLMSMIDDELEKLSLSFD